MDRLPVKNELLNGLLDMLPAKELAHIAPLLRICEHQPKDVIAAIGSPVRHVYFPYNAVLSTVVEYDAAGLGATGVGAAGEDTAATGATGMLESAVTGAEGFAPLDLFFGAPIAGATTLCKIGGASLRMSAENFIYERDHNPCFRYALALYVEVHYFQLSRHVACARLHSLKKRYARAILSLLDRAHSPEIPITQDYLARLLGVHRPSLNEYTRKFEAEGAIRVMRGRLIVTDRACLERHACECYSLLRHECERTLGMRMG